ncbi:MAG: TlyA family RNA methyltransferase [Epsilonproteobacteria bacterium]|nr:MAG: TlyA family RNA methyltransferase [Campylobacterota bacterium]
MRLDKYLVEEGYFESRNRALEAIKANKVKVNGRVVKPSAKIDINSIVEVENEKFYVSRAARKLENFLAENPIELQEKRVLDIGSSTGGFAQILLENGVASLACVDVGYDQLHHSLRKNQKLSLYENKDIRDFISEEPFEVISCDVSFISILQIIEDIDRLAAKNSTILILYKPQFEVGREVRRDSRGVVMDRDAIRSKKNLFESKVLSLSWTLLRQAPSQVRGKEGNQEYLYYFKKQTGE